jgi:hypothetical protein
MRSRGTEEESKENNMKFVWASVMAAIMMAGTLYADDTSSMREEIADLRAKVAALETAEMAPAAGGDCASLTSMKKKGTITIGGDTQVAIVFTHQDDQASVSGGQDDELDSTTFTTADCDLKFNIAANKNQGLVLLLDLDDFWNHAVIDDQDDLLEEAYFYFRNIAGTPWSINFGKKAVPFGQGKDPLVLASVTNEAEGRHFIGYEDAFKGLSAGDGDANPHANPSANANYPGQMTDTFQINPSFQYKDLLTLEMALFQDPGSRGMHEDRSDDHLLFESYSMRAVLTPLEGLSMELSYMNRHNDSMEDDLGVQNAENCDDDTHAISLGADYKLKSLPLEVYGEYMHGWDYGYNDEQDVDVLELGAIWGVTEAIDLILVGSWVSEDIDDIRSGGNAGSDEDLYSVQMGVQYKLETGMVLSLEYQHDWYDFDIDGADDYDQDADALAFGIIWSF